MVSWFREASMLDSDEQMPVNTYQLEQLNGDNLYLQAQGKTTVVYFFAPWCQICNLSVENLEAIYQKNSNISVIAVALDYENKASVVEFVQRHQLSFPIVYGNSVVKDAFKVKAYPSYYILNKENIIIGKSLGYSTETGLYLRTL
jgi:thiol-disulfide isomerase/thioredoxin